MKSKVAWNNREELGQAHQGVVDETCCEWMDFQDAQKKVQHIPNFSHMQVRVMICNQVRDTETGACDMVFCLHFNYCRSQADVAASHVPMDLSVLGKGSKDSAEATQYLRGLLPRLQSLETREEGLETAESGKDAASLETAITAASQPNSMITGVLLQSNDSSTPVETTKWMFSLTVSQIQTNS